MSKRQEQEQRRQDQIKALELWDVQAVTVQARLDKVAHRLQARLPDAVVKAEIADQGNPQGFIETGESPETLANVSIWIDLGLDGAELLAYVIEAGLASLSER